jgi:hypothetical protein
MPRYAMLSLISAVLLAACSAAPPPTSRRVVAHASAADAAGTVLVVDVCLNHSPLGTDDYFVISNARQGAAALTASTAQYFDASDVRIRTKLVPFVCGAVHDADNAPKRVAEAIDAEVSVRPQPLWVAPEISADAEYVQALQTLATTIFQGSLAQSTAAASASASANAGPSATEAPEAVRKAAAVVAQRSGRSSLIYVGVTGHSLSSGKATALGVARFAAALALSVAAGPVFTAGGTSYGVIFVPGGPVDKHQTVAALFDLQQATLVRSKVVHGGGDPMKPEVLSRRESVQLLLRDVAFANADK